MISIGLRVARHDVEQAIAIVLPKAKAHRPTAVCVLIAVALSCAFYYLPVLKEIPSGFTIIICAVLAAAVMAVAAPVKAEEESHE